MIIASLVLPLSHLQTITVFFLAINGVPQIRTSTFVFLDEQDVVNFGLFDDACKRLARQGGDKFSAFGGEIVPVIGAD